MRTWRDEDVIEVLACDIAGRPEAPGPEALAPFVIAAREDPHSITIELDMEGRDVAEAFVAAEQVCCADISWKLNETPRFTLRITAQPEQIVVLRALIPPGIDIEQSR